METEEPPLLEKILVQLTMGIFGRLVYRGFVNSLGLKGDERVLDFGSGWGVNAMMMAEKLTKGGRITCLDVSTGWLEIAKKRLRKFGNVEFILGDISRADIPDKTFDLIVVHLVLHHVDPSARDGTVKELARVLKDNGRIVIRDPQRRDHGVPADEIRRLLTGVDMKESNGSTYRSPFFMMVYEGTWTRPSAA